MKPAVILVPGIINPAEISFGPLLTVLRDDARLIPKELEVYAAEAPPHEQAIEAEVEGIARTAGECELESFHLVGYSAGGIAALAFLARYPQRVRSVTLIEQFGTGNPNSNPAEEAFFREAEGLLSLPPVELISRFLRLTLRPGVEPPAPPDMTTPWMAKRPDGIRALVHNQGSFSGMDRCSS